jgi:hypothetical protein
LIYINIIVIVVYYLICLLKQKTKKRI